MSQLARDSRRSPERTSEREVAAYRLHLYREKRRSHYAKQRATLGCEAMRLSLRRIAVALLLPLWLAIACSRETTPLPNVILITVDTVRADRMGYNGYARNTTPSIDRLAAESVIFVGARSPAGWTLPAMASLFTARRPRIHGARDVHSPIDRNLPVLPEILRDRGYDTRAYISSPLVGPRYGFDRGFDLVDTAVADSDTHRTVTSSTLTDRALADLDTRPLRGPLCLWIHYFDPHSEYVPAPEWDRFGPSESDRYDGEIAATDFQIGRLLDGLRTHGLEQHAIVVFTADHGEAFGEHNGEFHNSLHAEVTNIPLVIRAPGIAPARRPGAARMIDIAPTVVARLGLAPPPGSPGRDLLAEAGESEAALYYERDLPSRFRQRAIEVGRHKLIVVDPQQPDPLDAEIAVRGVEPGIFVYDTVADPGETKNLYSPGDPVAESLLASLREYFQDPALGRSTAP